MKVEIAKKKPVEPVPISITTELPSTEDGSIENRSSSLLTLDSSGVKLSDLLIELHDKSIHVVGTRHRGQSKFSFRKIMKVEDERYDLSQAKAYLIDWVLTLVVPRVIAADQESKTSSNTRK